VRAGNVYTILTAQGGVTGTFNGTAAISAILTPTFVYNANSVDVRIQAGLYANVVSANSAVQRSYATMLDSSRASAGPTLASLYATLDLQNQATIQGFLESIAPRFESLRTAIGVAETENMSRFYRQRIEEITPGEATGQLAMMGQPLQFAQASATYGAAAAVESDATANMVQTAAVPLPENMSGYITAGYIDGDSRPMPAAASAGRDQFNGWFFAVGLEREIGDHASGGFSIAYTDLNGQTGGAPQQVGGKLIQGTLYGALRTRTGLRLDGQLSAGQPRRQSRRHDLRPAFQRRRARVQRRGRHRLRRLEGRQFLDRPAGVAALRRRRLQPGPRAGRPDGAGHPGPAFGEPGRPHRDQPGRP